MCSQVKARGAMSVYHVLPYPDLGAMRSPNQFAAWRSQRRGGLNLIKNIWDRFPNQPPMAVEHPALMKDVAMDGAVGAAKSKWMMTPTDGRFFPFMLRLSSARNQELRAEKVARAESYAVALADAKAVRTELDHLHARIDATFDSPTDAKNFALAAQSAGALVAGTIGMQVYQAAVNSVAPSMQNLTNAALPEGGVPPVATLAIKV